MDHPREIGSARLLFRFIVGGAGLATDWLGSALRAIEKEAIPPARRPRWSR
jgi:hypothetical protein